MKSLGGVIEFPWAIAAGTDAPYLPDYKQTPAEKLVSGYFNEVRST